MIFITAIEKYEIGGATLLRQIPGLLQVSVFTMSYLQMLRKEDVYVGPNRKAYEVLDFEVDAWPTG